MASVFTAGSARFVLAVGVSLFAEAAVLFVLHHRTVSRRRDHSGSQLPMLMCMGLTLTSGGVTQLRAWTGAGMTAMFVVGTAAAVATLVFAIRSLRELRRDAPPSKPG